MESHSEIRTKSKQTTIFANDESAKREYKIFIPNQYKIKVQEQHFLHQFEVNGCSFQFEFYPHHKNGARYAVSLRNREKPCNIQYITEIVNKKAGNHIMPSNLFASTSLKNARWTTVSIPKHDLYNEEKGFLENDVLTIHLEVTVTKRVPHHTETFETPNKKLKLTEPNYKYEEQIPGDEAYLTLAPVRNGQSRFRAATITKYGPQCVITGTKLGVEAAHVKPYSVDRKYELDNVLLLEKGLHDCFDNFLWTIKRDHSTKSLRVVLGEEMNKDEYRSKVRDRDLDGLELGWFNNELKEALYNEKTGVKEEYLNLHQQEFGNKTEFT
jgi:hypothetical protein